MSVKEIGSLLMSIFGCSASNFLISAAMPGAVAGSAAAQFANVTTVFPLALPELPQPPAANAVRAKQAAASFFIATPGGLTSDLCETYFPRTPCRCQRWRPGCGGSRAGGGRGRQ